VSGHFEFWIVSGRVGSGRVFGHLVLNRFGFRVVSGRVGSGIRSSSVRSFRISDCIRSSRIGYWIIQCQIISSFRSYQIRTDWTNFSDRIGFRHLYVKVWMENGCTLYFLSQN
jgi:hypothetical protein